MTYQYNKINFKDLVVSEPNRYKITHNLNEPEETTETVVIQEHFGTITQTGTVVSAANLNHMEDGISAATSKFPSWNENYSYSKDETVSVVTNDGLKLFMSLQDENLGHNPQLDTSETYWKGIDLGGNGYDWIGTLAQYNAAVEAGEIQSDWICLITDDSTSVSVPTIDDTTASTTKVYSSSKIESILGNLEDILSNV